MRKYEQGGRKMATEHFLHKFFLALDIRVIIIDKTNIVSLHRRRHFGYTRELNVRDFD